MVLVKKNSKLRVCVDYRKLNACTDKDHFLLPFITLILEEVGGHARFTFMVGYMRYNQISHSITRYSQNGFHHSFRHVCVGGHAIKVV